MLGEKSSPIPCYRCWFMTPRKAAVCEPKKCQLLDQWLENAISPMPLPMSIPITLSRSRSSHNIAVKCPRCSSTKIVRNGVDVLGQQRYRCKNCKRAFRNRPGYSNKMKHRDEVIAYALDLAAQNDPAFSTRDIAKEINLKFQVRVSHVTVARWLYK